MKTSTTYKIRPAGRHILTIGRDLIQDNYAAGISHTCSVHVKNKC